MEAVDKAIKGKKLAIIGGSYLQLPLILKAKELGVITYCFSWLDGAVCKDYCDHFFPISILEKDSIFEECRKEVIEGVTTIASDAAVPTVNFVATRLNLVGNPYEKSEQYINKYCMRLALEKANVKVPKFINLTLETLSESYQRVEEGGLKLPIIVKPVDRSGSRGVFKIDDFTQLEKVVLRASQESFSKSVIIEEYIEGREFSIESLSWCGQHYILAITEKETTGAPYFVELAHHQPASLTEEESNSVEQFTSQNLTALEIINGASHTEIKITAEGEIYLIETGARMGGDFIGSDLVQLSTDYDFLKGVIEVAFGVFKEPFINNRKYSGVYFLSKEREYLKEIILSVNQNSEIVKSEILDDKIRYVTNSSDRAGYIIYQSDRKIVY